MFGLIFKALLTKKVNAFMTVQLILFLCVGTAVLTNIYLVASITNKRMVHYGDLQKLDAIVNALKQFARSRGRLPYPSRIIDGHIDGIEMEHPDTEDEWSNAEQYSYGALPYKTLGIQEYMARTQNKYIEYIVNPTLCGRKNVRYVSPRDPRVELDRRRNDPICLSIIGSRYDCAINGQPESRTPSLSDYKRVVPPQHYASISCVRGHINVDQHTDMDEPPGHVQYWDLATHLSHLCPKIYLKDHKEYIPQPITYRVYDFSVKSRNAIQSYSHNPAIYYFTLLGYALLRSVEADELDADHADTARRIDNVFACAIVSSKGIKKIGDNMYQITDDASYVLSRAELLESDFGNIHFFLC